MDHFISPKPFPHLHHLSPPPPHLCVFASLSKVLLPSPFHFSLVFPALLGYFTLMVLTFLYISDVFHGFTLALSLFHLLFRELYHIHVPLTFRFHPRHAFSQPRTAVHNSVPYSLILSLSFRLRLCLLLLSYTFLFLSRITLCFFFLYTMDSL